MPIGKFKLQPAIPKNLTRLAEEAMLDDDMDALQELADQEFTIANRMRSGRRAHYSVAVDDL